MTTQYVYGVTYAGAALPSRLQGIDGAAVTLVTQDRCAALVSELSVERPLGIRDDLIAHERVLESLAREETPILPFRFGAAMSGPEEVEMELLAGNQHGFLEGLERIAGRIELVVKGRYEGETAYREVVGEEPEVLEIRERIQGLPEDASYHERVRMGELVAQALARKQVVDNERLVTTLSAHAEDVVARPPASEDEVANAAFLVKKERRSAFEQALEAVGEEWVGRVRLRLIGPVPPYDFVASRVTQQV
jgi:hypothetical protein